jgi:hypothetical protein
MSEKAPMKLVESANIERRSSKSAPTNPLPEHPLLRLQRKIGNRAVSELVRTKLRVGPAGDRFEREADRVAERVMRMPARDGGPIATTPDASGELRRACRSCAEKSEALREDDEEHALRRKEQGPAPAAPPEPGVLNSGGAPLPRNVRHFYESRFGHDFRDVRVHSGETAARYNEELNAHAFTYGQHIWLGVGHRPEPTLLLAHELAHVLQACSEAPVLRRKGEAEETPRKDTRAGTLITSILINIDSGRVAFLTDQGAPIRGSADTDLKPGSYTVKLDAARQRWVFDPGQVKAGLRFDVDLEGAIPWTLSYPETIPVLVSHGLDADGGKSVDQASDEIVDLVGKQDFKAAFAMLGGLNAVDLGDLLSKVDAAHEETLMILLQNFSIETAGQQHAYRLLTALEATLWDENKLFVDNFIGCYVDKTSFSRDPEREKAHKWNVKLIFTYPLTPERAIMIYADDIMDGGTKSKAHPHYGQAGLLFPATLNQANTPRMWQKKKDIIAKIEEQNFEFVWTAYNATETVLGMVQVGQGLLTSTIPAATNPVTPSPGPPRPAKPSGGGSEPERPLLPRLTETTRANMKALMEEHPGLTEVNAERALRGPQGADVTMLGKGGTTETNQAGMQGRTADLVFTQRTPNGNVVLRREVKVITSPDQLQKRLSEGAKQVIAHSGAGSSGGEVLIQAPEGADVAVLIKGFAKGRPIEKVGVYRSIKVTVVDPNGKILYEGPAVP